MEILLYYYYYIYYFIRMISERRKNNSKLFKEENQDYIYSQNNGYNNYEKRNKKEFDILQSKYTDLKAYDQIMLALNSHQNRIQSLMKKYTLQDDKIQQKNLVSKRGNSNNNTSSRSRSENKDLSFSVVREIQEREERETNEKLKEILKKNIAQSNLGVFQIIEKNIQKQSTIQNKRSQKAEQPSSSTNKKQKSNINHNNNNQKIFTKLPKIKSEIESKSKEFSFENPYTEHRTMKIKSLRASSPAKLEHQKYLVKNNDNSNITETQSQKPFIKRQNNDINKVKKLPSRNPQDLHHYTTKIQVQTKPNNPKKKNIEQKETPWPFPKYYQQFKTIIINQTEAELSFMMLNNPQSFKQWTTGILQMFEKHYRQMRSLRIQSRYLQNFHQQLFALDSYLQ